MAKIQAANNGYSKLAAAISNAVTSFEILSIATFPAEVPFMITIDDEIMRVTAVTGNNLTVTRAQEGTAAAAHDAGEVVRCLWTAGTYDNIFDMLGFSKTGISISGGGNPIEAGVVGEIEIPYDCEIKEVTLLADVSGSIIIDIWKDTYANFPPTSADSITAAAKPTISGTIKSKDTTLTGWAKTIAAGDILRFNVDSCTYITRCTLILKVEKL